MARKIWIESPRLDAVILSIKIAGPELRKQLYAQARNAIVPDWQKDLARRASTTLHNRLTTRVLVDTARVNVTTNGLTLTAAKSKRKLSGGLVPASNWAPLEFGTGKKEQTVRGRRGGTSYTYKRRQNVFSGPSRTGYVVYPTIKEHKLRYIALWIQTTARTLHEALEGKL